MNRHQPLVRLNKFLADCGIASRREADRLIVDGKVLVNGKTNVALGTKIDPRRDKVFVDGRQVVVLDKPIYIVFNKPKDCITTTSDERARTTVMDYVRVDKRIYPIGRLDRNTTGILLLTNDGELANRLMHPRFKVKKTYKVTLDRPITPEDVRRLVDGIELEDGKTSESKVTIFPDGRRKVLAITIHEGRNRQVRRMFEALGYEVEKLDRIAYAGIGIENLRRGEWRYLTKAEFTKLKRVIGFD